MTGFLLLAALAAQQLTFRDAAAVNAQLAALRTADPAVCEMAGRTLTNQWGWGGDPADEPAPMPTPMPVPMPMPFAAAGAGVSGLNVRHRAAPALDAKVLAVFRAAPRRWEV